MRFLCKIGIHRWIYDYKLYTGTKRPMVDDNLSYVKTFYKNKDDIIKELPEGFFDSHVLYWHLMDSKMPVYTKQRLCKYCDSNQTLSFHNSLDSSYEGWENIPVSVEDVRDKKIREILK
jgi:hypothetical protein